jgi:hypothetical protein
MTGRDLAMAQTSIAVASAIAAIAPKGPQKEKYNRLTITLKNGHSWWAEVAGADVQESLTVWRDFLRWYHGRTASPAYIQRLGNGATMIRRCDIRAYDIRWGEREKSDGSGGDERT